MPAFCLPGLFRRMLLVTAAFCCINAHAGSDLETIKARGVLHCGVSEDIPGFAQRDQAGEWRGLNVDFCRAVAAAIFGDPQRAVFMPLTASQRFPALKGKRVDLLLRNATWTFAREAQLKLEFPAVLFHDGQAFMLPKSARIRSPEKLAGKTVCVEKGTTHEKRLISYFAARGAQVSALIIDSAGGAADALFAGRCQAYTSDASQLAALLTRAGSRGKEFEILSERISKEPLGPVVRSGDPEWASLVRWVRNVLVAAEEDGLTAANIDSRLPALAGSQWDAVSGVNDLPARNLGVRKDWAIRALKAAGNYGEIYERHFGKDTPLPIERGQNRLWSQGGLLFAPPFE